MRNLGVTLLAFALIQPALATNHQSQAGHVAQSAATMEMSDGTVKKVDAAKGRVTIEHGPLKNLNMPPMTMVFRAAKPELLNGIAAGDRIRFNTEDKVGKMVVTAIEKAQ
jgi:Cu/Ag efflux protein CusF